MRVRTVVGVVVGLFACSGAAWAQPALSASEGIVREGAGTRRSSLNAMELKPFPMDLWGGIGAWSGGEALTSGEASGKPVLVVTWQSWYDPSVRLLSAAQRIADQYAADGLIVVGLHDNEEWSGAADVAKGKGVTFRLAQDTGNKMRAALMVDQDPDVYVIDRAGQLRFADVDAASMEQAVKIVCKETPDAASKINETLAEKAKQDRIKAQSTAAINSEANLTSIPELPFPDVNQELYLKVTWPKLPTSSSSSQQVANPILGMPGDGEHWSTGKAPAGKGRITVVYFWDPDYPGEREWIVEMDQLQKELGRDAYVVGAMTEFDIQRGGSFPDESKRAELLEQLQQRFKVFSRTNRLVHPLLYDAEGLILGSIFQSSSTYPADVCAIASSDGVVRWWGSFADPSCKSAIQSILSSDPGVKARRAAESQWLKARGK